MPRGAANSIRQIQGAPPAGARMVGTYRNAAGYIRRRWQTGPRQYVEKYEHRHVTGAPAGTDVDHRNRRKGDNSRANLQVLSRTRHNQVAALRKRRAARRVSEG